MSCPAHSHSPPSPRWRLEVAKVVHGSKVVRGKIKSPSAFWLGQRHVPVPKIRLLPDSEQHLGLSSDDGDDDHKDVDDDTNTQTSRRDASGDNNDNDDDDDDSQNDIDNDSHDTFTSSTSSGDSSSPAPSTRWWKKSSSGHSNLQSCPSE
jgi:hypothetical protein